MVPAGAEYAYAAPRRVRATSAGTIVGIGEGGAVARLPVLTPEQRTRLAELGAAWWRALTRCVREMAGAWAELGRAFATVADSFGRMAREWRKFPQPEPPAHARGRLAHAEVARLAKQVGLPPPRPHYPAGGYGLWQVTPAARAFDPLENMKAAAAIFLSRRRVWSSSRFSAPFPAAALSGTVMSRGAWRGYDDV